MIKRHSLLRKLTLEISDDGKVAKGLVIFQEGAWDTEEKLWVGIPIETPGPLNNIDAEGKKRLNDVLGVAVTKALEDNATYREANAKMAVQISQLLDQVRNLTVARDNALALKSNAEAELIRGERMLVSSRERAADLLSQVSKDTAKLAKIRRLTFGLLGK